MFPALRASKINATTVELVWVLDNTNNLDKRAQTQLLA